MTVEAAAETGPDRIGAGVSRFSAGNVGASSSTPAIRSGKLNQAQPPDEAGVSGWAALHAHLMFGLFALARPLTPPAEAVLEIGACLGTLARVAVRL